ncbi:MAG: UvrD-helicase domain-containing protein [Acholeplasma sp.]|nr:UvrD-helicase domain-containing protein [Acholeplasma sp.]
MNLTGLNEKQQEAVKSIEGSVAVIAGAGSGKTRTLTYRIANMIDQGIDPKTILAVTFTNKAAKEMKERVVDLVGPSGFAPIISTFHSFCARFIRDEIDYLGSPYNRHYLIMDEDDAKQVIRDSVKELNLDPNRYTANRLKDYISKVKNGQYDQLDFEDEKIFHKYNDYLKQNNAMDFDDLLNFTVQLLRDHEDLLEKYQNYYQYILIDEFQDTNIIQYELVKLMGSKRKNVFIVGDPDQSIYGFRGANYENYTYFLNDFKPKVIVLDENYRSTMNVLNAANKLISNNRNRKTIKNLKSELGDGTKVIQEVRESDKDEAYFVARAIEIVVNNGVMFKDVAVLYRSNAIGRIFEEAFIKYNIPYVIYGGTSFFARKEIKDVLSYIRLALFEEDNISLKRVINTPRRKIGSVTIGKLETYAQIYKISMYDALDKLNVTGQTKEALLSFKSVIETLKKEIQTVYDLTQVVDIAIRVSGYEEMLRQEGNEGKDRYDNIMELKSIFYNGSIDYRGTNLEKIEQILDDLALKTDVDLIEDRNTVKVATIHQVKGLEFKVVFMVAMEESIFPSDIMGSFTEIEEERRVAYVGVTRAKERLILSCAKQRFRFGQVQYNMPSRFLEELSLETKDTPRIIIKNTPTPDPDFVEDDIKVGDQVFHEKYGKGVVVMKNDDITRVAFSVDFGLKLFTTGHQALKKIKTGN